MVAIRGVTAITIMATVAKEAKLKSTGIILLGIMGTILSRAARAAKDGLAIKSPLKTQKEPGIFTT